ncbi:MAG: sulfur carrier protein ThiS [Methyloceanibacter sp.]
MQILLNGEAYATDAKTLDELCARLGLAEAKIATAVNGNFVASVARPAIELAPADEIEIVAPRQGG